MGKNKFYAIFLIIIFILSGCGTGQKSAGKNSAAGLKPGNIQAVSGKQQKIQEPVYESPKLNKELKKNGTSAPSGSLVKEIDGFVLLSSLDNDIIIDLRYATADNFTKKVVYPDNICVLRNGTAEKLVKANAQLEKLGYRIKVWDAYRPVYVQKIFWNLVKDSRFVANPYTGGSIHNKGCAVDVTLVNMDGTDVSMPSGFDEFSTAACRSNAKMTCDAKKNLDILTKCMVDNGFSILETEWWHFEDTDSKNYKISDINLKLFKGEN